MKLDIQEYEPLEYLYWLMAIACLDWIQGSRDQAKIAAEAIRRICSEAI